MDRLLQQAPLSVAKPHTPAQTNARARHSDLVLQPATFRLISRHCVAGRDTLNRDRAVPSRHHCCMRRKLAPKIIEHLKTPGPKRLEVWDTVLQGFGICVATTGRKVWFVVARVGDRQKRITIGTYPAISLAEARDEARKLIRNAQLATAANGAKGFSDDLGSVVDAEGISADGPRYPR